MEIQSKKELKFYLMADRMMNRGKFKRTFKDYVLDFIMPDYIMRYLTLMRKISYYSNRRGLEKYLCYYYKLRYNRLALKLGFSIGYNCFGYGLVIPHYGTIVVGQSNRIGNYAVLHTSTCISDNGKQIGNAFYLSTGAKVTSKIVLGDNISIGANSLVNKSNIEGNVMLAGTPARIIKTTEAWYIRDGKAYSSKIDKIESLKKQFLNEE